MNRTKAWLELVRLPNIFTAITDVLAGYWFVSGPMLVSWRLVALCLASASLYAFGIVLNDIADIEIDRVERPNRPLPSGRISVAAARRFASWLAIIGIALAVAAGFDTTQESPGFIVEGIDWRPAVIAVALAAAIAAYDLLAKGTRLGPVNMGACRGLNLILGMCAGWWFTPDIGLLAVGAMTLYVASLTYFGVDEAGKSKRFHLATGGGGALIAILVLGILIAEKTLTAETHSMDYFLLALWFALLIHPGRMALRAIRGPEPANVQRAMKTFILCIIVIDAVIAAASQGWLAAAVILAFLIPTSFVGRWIYST